MKKDDDLIQCDGCKKYFKSIDVNSYCGSLLEDNNIQKKLCFDDLFYCKDCLNEDGFCKDCEKIISKKEFK